MSPGRALAPRRRLAGPLLEAGDEVEGDHGAGIQILYVLGLAPRARKAGKALAPIDAAVVVITRARAVAETFVGEGRRRLQKNRVCFFCFCFCLWIFIFFNIINMQ